MRAGPKQRGSSLAERANNGALDPVKACLGSRPLTKENMHGRARFAFVSIDRPMQRPALAPISIDEVGGSCVFSRPRIGPSAGSSIRTGVDTSSSHLYLFCFLISIYISLNRHHLINDVVNFRSTVELEYLVIWFSGAGALSDRLIYYHRPSGTHEVARNGQPGYVRPKPGRRRPPILSVEKFLLYCHRVDRSERNNNLVAVLAGITCRSSRDALVPPPSNQI